MHLRFRQFKDPKKRVVIFNVIILSVLIKADATSRTTNSNDEELTKGAKMLESDTLLRPAAAPSLTALTMVETSTDGARDKNSCLSALRQYDLPPIKESLAAAALCHTNRATTQFSEISTVLLDVVLRR